MSPLWALSSRRLETPRVEVINVDREATQEEDLELEEKELEVVAREDSTTADEGCVRQRWMRLGLEEIRRCRKEITLGRIRELVAIAVRVVCNPVRQVKVWGWGTDGWVGGWEDEEDEFNTDVSGGTRERRRVRRRVWGGGWAHNSRARRPR